MNVRTTPTSRAARGRAARAASALALALLVTGLLLAGCGKGGTSPGAGDSSSPASASPSPGRSVSPSASPAAPETTALRVYFLRGEKLGVAERQVPRTKAVASAAVTALCGGVTSDEQAAGLGSALPAGTRLLGVSVRDGVATVDLSGEFAEGGGSLSMSLRVAQIVYTLTQFHTVTAVDFRMDGRPLTELGGEGLVLESGQKRADWQDYEPAIFVERPGVGAVVSSPFVLQGTAMVFEGAFMARLADDSGRRVVEVPVQASAGGPERGDFRKVVPFSTSAKAGMLIVYDQSMEDGSRRDEVRIPVTFAP